jgi:hypothetical protein
MSCGTLGLNILATWLVHLKDLRLKNLVIDESVQIKQLVHMYIGLISVGVDGDYVVKRVATQKPAIVKTTRILDISSLRRPRSAISQACCLE